MPFAHVFPGFQLFWGGGGGGEKSMDGCVARWYHLTWFCEVEIVHREEAEADLPDDVPASCYNCQITTQVLSCIIFDAL